MPDKKYLIEIPGMPEGSGVWDSDKWERNKDAFMSDYPEANVFELGEYDAEDTNENDQIMLTFENDPDSSGVWDAAKWERNKEAFTADHPEAKVNRVRYVDYWSNAAQENRVKREELSQPDAERDARLADLGYYDDMSGQQKDFSLENNTIGLKPVSSAIEQNSVSGETTYHDPKLAEFYANDSAHTERMAEIARLDAEYDSNPSIVAQREWEQKERAEQEKYIDDSLASIRADINTEVNALEAGKGAFYKTASSQGMGDAAIIQQAMEFMRGKDAGQAYVENEKLETYASAAKLFEKAKQAYDVAGKGFWGATADVGMDKLRDLATQSDIEAYNQIGDILTRLETRLGSLDEVTDKDIESNLSKEEQALIKGFFAYNEAMSNAQQDMSQAYKGGKIFGESISFMLEFLATGGLAGGTGKAAGNAVGKGLVKWAAKVAKGTAQRAARTVATKAARSLTSAAVGTLARTVAAPGTYQRMAEDSVKIEDGHLNRGKNAFEAFADSYIENLSEISGGVIGKSLKMAGVNPSKILGGMSFGKVGKMLADNSVMQAIAKGGKALFGENGVLKKFGFNGIFEEVEEEYIGNLIRELTIQPGALEEMHKDGNFGAMLIGFAPMTLFGAGMSAASIGAKNIEAANLGKKLRKNLSSHYTDEQIDHMMNLVSGAENADQVWEAIRPLTVGLSTEETQQLYQYGAFMAQNKAMLFAKKAQEDNLAQAKRAEAEHTYGKFWQETAEGAESVQLATLNDGRSVFVLSEPTSDGVVSIIDAKTGEKGFTNVSNYKTQEVNGEVSPMTQKWSMDAYLEGSIAADRMTAEQARMTREYDEQVKNLQSQIQEGTQINLGTEGSPVILLATGKFVKDGVVAVDQTGNTHTVGWNQVADAMGRPIIVKTDQQIVDEEIADIVARNAERRKKMSNATPAMTEAVNESAAQTSEAVAQETKHIPLNEDGTVNEAAFWEQDPEGYAQWNDEQNQDGGADTIQQIEAAKAELTAMLNEAQRATLTSNPANRKAAKREVSRLAERLARLEALEQSYADRALAPLRERAKMWADLTGAPVHVLETEEELAAISSTAASENAKQGSRVRGFAKDGRAYIFLPGIKDIKEIDEVFFHEAVAHNGLKGLLGKENYDKLCEQVWNMMSQAARNQFIRYPGVNGDYLAAADEYIAHIAEKMGAGIAEAEEKTIWQKIVAFVRDVLRAMGMEIKLTEQELSDLLHQAYADLANNMAKAEQIASGEAMSAVEEAPSEARQQYDALLADLTPEEIEAVAENDFNAAQEAYNAHLANAPKVEPGESSKAYVERKKAYNDELKRLEAELNAQQALMDEIAKAKQTETEEETIEPVEDLDQVQQEDGTFRLSVVTYNDWTDNLGNQHKGTRTMVLERMVAMNFTDAEINDMMRKMDTAYEYMEKLRSLTNEDGSVRFDEFNEWAKATPMYKQVGRDFVKAITSLVSNGDYPINMELTTDCIKREAYTMLLNTLIKRGADLSAMGPGEIVTIQKMMKQYGIETACALCFVEGKRLQIVNWASQIVEDWNAALVEAGVETEEHFGFGKDGDAFIPAEEWRTHENKAEVAKVMKQLDEIDLLFRGIDPVQFKKQKAKNKKAVEKYKKEKAEAWAKRAKRPLSEWKPTDKQEAEIKKMAKEGLAPTYVNENMEEYRNAFNAMRNEWLEKHPGKDPLSFTPTKKQWEALGKIRNRQIDTVKAKMVRLIMEYPEMRKKMTLNDLLGSKGLMEIRQQHGQAYADLYSIILQRFGTGTPKPVQDAVPYDGELMTLSESAFKKANEIGGARLFSFSDFDITKVFDYMQMFFDLEANRQMLRSYTKEVAAVIIFGRSNAKFNISTLANAYVPQEVLDEYAKAGEAKQKEMRHKWAENAGLQVDEAGNITGINFSEEHSVSPAFAQQIFHDDARNKDCGAIMVGASVNHAIYSAAQAWIRMVIPFHLSGMPKAAQDKTDVKWYFDNTPFQSTRKKTKEGWSKIESSEDTFKLYDDMSAPGWNMRDKAKQYLAWCAEKGFRPKFDWGINSDYYRAYCEEYGYTPNQQIIDIMDADTTDGVWNQYYKFLTDFTAYKPVFNEQGEMIDESPSPQLPVVANFDFSELEREVLFEGENSMLNRREENIQKAERHMDALAAQVVPYLDGEITEDEMGLRDDVFYKSSTDAENYLEEIEKQMRANKAVPEWFKNIRRSQELDQNNSPFILAPDGGIDFGEILPIHHLPAAPIRLSEGDAENGYIHINNRHGKEIQKQGFNSIEDFVKFVVDNFTRIQEGSAYENETGGQNQTYLVQLQDKHNNTLFIQLSRDGQYWNVNSAGVFKKNYGNNKKNIWSASEVQNDNSAVVDNGLQSEPNADTGSTSNGTPSDVSKGKDSENLVNTSDNTRLSVITPQMDAEYLAAVEAGDMKTAQRMVLEAAKLAMPNTKVVDKKGNPAVVHHGTKGKFNTFAYSREDIGFHFGTKGTARTRIGRGKDARIMQVFLNLENPLIFDTDLGSWDADYIVKDLLKKEMMSYDDAKAILLTSNGYKRNSVSALVDLRQWMSNNGYDGIVYPNWYESDGKDSYIAFNRNQIKSADPVTYGNNGNVIPLSQRFNPANEDIRFSARTDEQRQALFDKAKAQFGLTNNFKVAGYMLPDGSLLDFSEANNGGNPNQRSLDHREIEGIIMDEGIEYDSRWMYLADFMNEGAIRLLPEYAGINLMKAPTKEQRQKLFDFIYKYNGEVILEIADERLNNVAYVEYDLRTSPSRIFRDIDGYFNEGIVPQQDVRFSIANENQAILVSNAARAVEGIKMDKATPEQWLKMIEKNGGLKAGEDKWMGLSDWLKASDKKTLTKAEVLDFINEHKIVIEEQHYSNKGVRKEADKILNENYPGWEEAFSFDWDPFMEEPHADIYDEVKAARLYNETHEDQVETDEDGDIVNDADYNKVEEFGAELSGIWHGRGRENTVREIHGTREEYTTGGLENLHEIALTVPTIESWNESDDIHFGDAGEGRAVAWVRFGETWERRPSPQISRKVLVIDEIQSKRHQEGREKGYAPELPSPEELAEIERRYDEVDERASEFYDMLWEKYGSDYTDDLLSEEDKTAKEKIDAEFREASEEYAKYFSPEMQAELKFIPAAPFEKNWHELAMKRMLRYAAENGYDVIAWTKGEQQAERYGLQQVVDGIFLGAWDESTGTKFRPITLSFKDGHIDTLAVNEDGFVFDGTYKGSTLADVVGKDMAVRLMTTESRVIADNDLKIGGEGMKGFYDKMLPAFMNKYGKKWGVKVEDIDLSHLESGLTMHSVPVTEEMKASVMEGQVMFSVRTVNQTAQEFHNDALTDFRRQFNLIQPTAVVDVNDRAALAEALGLTPEELSDEKYQLILDGVNNGGRSFYDDDTKRIAIFALEEQRTSAEVSENIFHENTHAIISKNPELLELGQWLWDNAKPGAREKIKSAILEAGYPEWQDANEMLSRYTGAILAIGRAGEVLNMLPADQKKHWEFILKEFGYEPEREDGERIRRYDADSRRAGFFRKMSQQKMSDNGAAEKGTRFSSVGITPEVRDEMDRIAATAIFDGNYMLAPNGQPTKLTADQWAIVRTKNFINWFGDWINDPENASKVVDENGEPRVVYHGSPNAFTAFDKDMIGETTDPGFYGQGFYFATTKAEAKGYGKHIIDAFVSLENPLDLNTVYEQSKKWDGETADGAVRWWYGLASMFPEQVGDVTYASIERGDWTILELKNRIDELAESSETPFADAMEEFEIDDSFFDWLEESDINIPEEFTSALVANGYDGVINAGAENNEIVALEPNQIKSATDNTGEFSAEEGDIRYSLVKDPALLERLESEPTIKVYRAMQLVDGKLYPPMSAKVDGKMREPIELGKWEQAEERPDLADKKGYFKLDKGNKTSLKARYNPYFHTSTTPLNDQFASAQARPELVTVEVEVPESELTSGYKAEKAKDSVGKMEWKAGVVQGKLSGTRTVILSRWDKPVRIVPDSEVADVIVKMFEGKDITMPSNVVTPSLRAELEKRGVPFVETDNSGKPTKEDVRFSVITTPTEIEAVKGLSILDAMNISLDQEMTMVQDMIDAERALIKNLQKKNQNPLIEQQIQNAEKRLAANLRQMEILQDVKDQLFETKHVDPDYQSALSDLEPQTRFEYLSQLFTMHLTPITQAKVTAEDGTETIVRQGGKKNGIMLTPQTLTQELGWSKSDWKGISYIVSESDGTTIDAIAEMIEQDSEAGYLFAGMDTMQIKDEIIDFLWSMDTYASIRDYVKNARMRKAKEEADHTNALIDMRIEQLESEFGMSVDAYNAMIVQQHREARESWLASVGNPNEFAKFEEIKEEENGGASENNREGSQGVSSADEAQDVATSGEGDSSGEAIPEGIPGNMPGNERGAESGGGSRRDDTGSEGEDRGNGVVSDAVDTSRKSVDEIVETGKQKVVEANAAAADAFMLRLRNINGNLMQLRRAASAQREYDKNTVQIITSLANELLENGALSDMTRGEIKRLLSVIKDSVGKSDLAISVDRLMDIMIGNQLRYGRNRFNEYVKIRDKKVDARGIEVRGKLDVEGQMIMNALREGISLDAERLQERIGEAEDRLFDTSETIRRNAENDLVGYQIALEYLDEIKASEAEEKDLRKELKTAKEEYEADRMTKEAYKEFVKSTHDAIRENRMQRVMAYEGLLEKMANMIQKSIRNAGQLREAEKVRIEQIQHYANSDLQGKQATAHKQQEGGFWNWGLVKLFTAPLATFEQWMRVFGQKSAEGKGYLYNHFVGGWNKANNEEYLGIKAAHEILDAKVREMFGGAARRWSDLFAIDKKLPKATVTMWDDGEMRDFEVTQGNLLYIYMVNKMTDGKMKLRKMGITEEDVAAMVRAMDPRFIELADWIQEDFLPGLRDKYNAVHEKLFGAPMSAIENYFPIKVLANARTREVSLGEDTESSKPSTITGSIIKRTKNSLALDVLGSNAFDVVLEHIEQMEHWAAFAGFNRDLNTLLSYNKFRNRVQNMNTALGSGKDAWNSFKETAEIVAGVYQPKASKADKTLTNVVRGLTTGKINFRLWTALKQILSMPAFLPYTNAKSFARNLATPWKAWNWAIENLPAFQKRWLSREAGNVRLQKTEADWKIWQNDIMEAASRWGMTPNAFVDAITCSIGAKSVYDTMYARYTKDGYAPEEAAKKAKLDATVAFNATQQSNEAAFVSAVQKDRSFIAYAMTVFRNNSFGMGRELADALRNMRDRMKSGYKEESIEFMTKQMVRDGLTEEQAARAAERIYRNSGFKDAARIATFGFVMQFLWNLGNSALYLLFGDDDEEKEKMIKDAAIRGAFGSAEGLGFGNIVAEASAALVSGDIKNYRPSFSPAGSDIKGLMNELKSDPVSAASEMINILAQAIIGVNPQTLVDAALAIYDACDGDIKTSKEVAIALLRILNAPQSNIDKLIMDEIDFTDEQELDMTIAEFARNYAKYKKIRNAPYTFIAYSDEKDKKVEDKYIKRFMKDAEAAKRTRGTEEAKEFYGYYDAGYEEMAESIRDIKKQAKEAYQRGEEAEAESLLKQLENLTKTEEFKLYEDAAVPIKAYEGYKNLLKDINDPKARKAYTDSMLVERDRAVKALRKHKAESK